MGTYITGLTAAQTDADSPVNQTLMDTIRTDIEDLDTTLAEVYDGTDVATDKVSQDSIAASAVGQGELKTSATAAALAVAAASGVTQTAYGALEYGFYITLRTDNAGATGSTYAAYPLSAYAANPGATYQAWVNIQYTGTPSVAHNYYAQLRYVQASEEQPFLGVADLPGYLFTHHKPGGALNAAWFSHEAPWYPEALRRFGPEAASYFPDAPDFMPHPFGNVGPGEEVRCYDLRALCGDGEYHPRAERLAREEPKLLHIVESGDAVRADKAQKVLQLLRVAAAAETKEQAAAKRRLETMHESTEKVRATILRGNLSAAQEVQVLRRLRMKERRKWFSLRHKANALREVEALHQSAIDAGGDLLEEVLLRRLPILDTHTVSVSDDKTHPLYSALPESFRKRSGQPFVRLMAAP